MRGAGDGRRHPFQRRPIPTKQRDRGPLFRQRPRNRRPNAARRPGDESVAAKEVRLARLWVCHSTICQRRYFRYKLNHCFFASPTKFYCPNSSYRRISTFLSDSWLQIINYRFTVEMSLIKTQKKMEDQI
jgi:hypothetical protein